MDQKPQVITSLQNDQIKGLIRLRNRRERDQRQLTILEEPLVISRALAAGYPLQTVYFCPEQLNEEGQQTLADLRAGCSAAWVQLAPQVMVKAAYREKPAGLLVVAPQVGFWLDSLDLPAAPDQPPLVLVLEAVEKPGNLGAVLRIADAAAAHAVFICGQGTDIFNPNVLRASRGAFFSVPTVAAETADILDFLRARHITITAASPGAANEYTAADLSGPQAIVLGTEHQGLTPGLLASCDSSVSIPMLGRGDSLNLASSAAILLYEAVRQRHLNQN